MYFIGYYICPVTTVEN